MTKQSSARPFAGSEFYDEVLVLDDARETVPLYTLRRPSRPSGPRELAGWETRTFSTFAANRDVLTPFDDDPLADLDETRAALDRIRPL
ncbi:MAG: hypothetical protein Q7V57_02360 [Actinomycetota bacterium]|nr:hypothetical protein [Actinomycetota bacterium]